MAGNVSVCISFLVCNVVSDKYGRVKSGSCRNIDHVIVFASSSPAYNSSSSIVRKSAIEGLHP